ncbi:hypothetical protein GCM10027265_32590 [Jatrophihabitans fulvus]
MTAVPGSGAHAAEAGAAPTATIAVDPPATSRADASIRERDMDTPVVRTTGVVKANISVE